MCFLMELLWEIGLRRLPRQSLKTWENNTYSLITECRQTVCWIETQQIQSVIDRAANEGGGVIVVPRGTFLSGAIFFRQGTSLYIEEGGKLKGSEDIADFPVLTTRIEGRRVNIILLL